MAKKTAPKKPSKRGRKKGEQLHFNGTGPEKNARVHPLALEYVNSRDARMELLTEEVKLKARLLDAMHEEALTAYEYDDINVTINAKEEIKVKKGGKDAEE